MAEYIERGATCKDCLHVDVCYHIEHYGRILETDEPCKHFKHTTADVVEVRHGVWEYYNGSGYVRPHFRCTKCGQARYEHYACNDFKYCPNCGAKMDGKGEGE